MTIRKRRRLQTNVWWALALLCLVLALFPIQSGISRLILVLGTFTTWALGLFVFWRSLPARVLFLLPFAAVVGLALMPYRLADADRLREANVAALRSYVGTRYLWGGESRLGIDCSGLVRRGLIDASFAEGWRTKDLSLLRTGAALWWYDASAKSLGEGYQGRTRLLSHVGQLNDLPANQLQPGDLAVTENGMHVLAYLGEETWIEADPNVGKVITVKMPSKDIWFSMPMRLLRWYRL